MYEKFIKLLTEKGISAYQLAKDTGIRQSTFTDWKYGRYTPKVEKMKKIADYFGVSIDYFYGERK